MDWKLIGVLGVSICLVQSAANAEDIPATNLLQSASHAENSDAEISSNADELTNSIFAARSIGEVVDEFLLTTCQDPGVDSRGVPGYMPAECAGGAAAKKYPTIDLTGFVQIDAVWFKDSAGTRANDGDVQDWAGFRRARLAAKGQLAEDIRYHLEMDFAFAGRPSFMDVWVEKQQLPILGTVRIGQFRQPLSMSALTSVRDLMFLERALPFAFVPFRQVGVMSYNSAFDDQVTWAASIYKFPTDVYGNAFGDSGYGTSYRITAVPIDDTRINQVVHLGFGYSYNDPGQAAMPGSGENDLSYSQSPEVGISRGNVFNNTSLTSTGVTGPFFTATGAIPDIHHNSIYNVELAYALESFLVQSEFFYVTATQNSGNTYNYSGAYVHSSYVLTGEKHPYNKQTATFGRVIPKQNFGRAGWGAWEVAGRWSYIDLRDSPNAFSAGAPYVNPARLNDLTFGLNWYWNTNAKMQFNYIHVFQNAPVAPVRNAGTDILALRTQFDF
jgi:phosphate-selective porin OprO/OprP